MHDSRSTSVNGPFHTTNNFRIGPGSNSKNLSFSPTQTFNPEPTWLGYCSRKQPCLAPELTISIWIENYFLGGMNCIKFLLYYMYKVTSPKCICNFSSNSVLRCMVTPRQKSRVKIMVLGWGMQNSRGFYSQSIVPVVTSNYSQKVLHVCQQCPDVSSVTESSLHVHVMYISNYPTVTFHAMQI